MSKLLLSTLMAGCVVLAAPFAEAKFPYDVQIRNHHHVASLTAQQWLDLCSTRLSAQWQNESNAVFNRPVIYRFRIDTTGTITDLKLDQSSGNPAIDKSAKLALLSVFRDATIYELTPARPHPKSKSKVTPVTLWANMQQGFLADFKDSTQVGMSRVK